MHHHKTELVKLCTYIYSTLKIYNKFINSYKAGNSEFKYSNTSKNNTKTQKYGKVPTKYNFLIFENLPEI